MPDWGTTTARVLCRLRFVTLAALKNATEQQKAAINRVWEFVEVDRNEYNKDMSGQWRSVKGKERRNRVREQLRTRFSEEAFLDNPSGKAARKKFTRADLLAWGEQLLNPADAAANAVSDANAGTPAEGVQGDPRVSEADVQKPEGGEAADAAANVADGAAVADRVAVETTNAAVADAAAAFSPAPQERGPPAGEPTASEGVDGELPLCLNDVSSQTANSYNQMTIKTHGHVVYDFEGKKRTINLQDLTNFDCMKEKTRPEVKGICASVYFLQDLLTIYPRGPHGRRDPLSMISSPDYDRILKQINERTERTVANAMEIDALRVDSCDEDEPPTDGAPLEEPKGAVAVDAAFVLDERGADDASAMETDPTLPNFELPTTTNADLQEIINNPVQYNNSSRLQKLLSGRDRHTADEIRQILPELRRYAAQTQNQELQHLISKFEASVSTGSRFWSRIYNSIASGVSSIFSSSVISSTESLSKEAPAKKKQLVRQARLDQGLSSTTSRVPLMPRTRARLSEGITNGIRVRASVAYEYHERRHVYTIRIRRVSDDAPERCQLRSHRFTIRSHSETTSTESGDALDGDSPILTRDGFISSRPDNNPFSPETRGEFIYYGSVRLSARTSLRSVRGELEFVPGSLASPTGPPFRVVFPELVTGGLDFMYA